MNAKKTTTPKIYAPVLGVVGLVVVVIAIGLAVFRTTPDAGVRARVETNMEAVRRGDLDGHRAVEVLEELGPQAMPALMETLKDKDEDVRLVAAEAVLRLGPTSKEAVLAVIEMLESNSIPHRETAAIAITQPGFQTKEAKEAVPVLLEMLEDEHKRPRLLAARALGKVGFFPKAKEAVPALIKMLKDENDDHRLAAAEVLGRIGPEAKKQHRL